MASSDPNFNTNAASENLMSSVNTTNLGFSNLVETNNSAILPLENDLYQFLQSTGDAREDFDNFEDELDFPYHIIDSAPSSTCTSACSSAATSPVPYNIYNTPPVTPQPDRTRQNSPTFLTPLETQQQQQLQPPPPLMSGFEPGSALNQNDSYLRNRLMDPSLSDRTVSIKQEPELLDQMPGYNTMSAGEEGLNQRPLQLTAQVKNENNGRVKRSLQGPGSDQPSTKKPRNPAKGTAEYQQKREKNNVAVRRSRDKAKQKAMETQHKVQLLTAENKKLHDRVAELTHELTTLKNLLKSLPQYQNNINA